MAGPRTGCERQAHPTPDPRCEAHVSLLDAHGRGVHVTPGVVDDAARYAYMNGQCLAFAAALTERGMTPVLVLAGGGLDWEQDTASFDPRDTHLFVHALASDGVDVHDITGTHDPAHLLESMRDGNGRPTARSTTQLGTLTGRPFPQNDVADRVASPCDQRTRPGRAGARLLAIRGACAPARSAAPTAWRPHRS